MTETSIRAPYGREDGTIERIVGRYHFCISLLSILCPDPPRITARRTTKRYTIQIHAFPVQNAQVHTLAVSIR